MYMILSVYKTLPANIVLCSQPMKEAESSLFHKYSNLTSQRVKDLATIRQQVSCKFQMWNQVFFSPQSPPVASHLALSGWWTRRSHMISSLVNIFDLVSYDLSLYSLTSTTLVFLNVLELVRRVSGVETLHILFLHLGWFFFEYLEGLWLVVSSNFYSH